ncbi:MAG: hypothetical protein ACKOF3_01100 [Spartobacteria bacterium]
MISNLPIQNQPHSLPATPFVEHVLALPDLTLSPDQPLYQGQPRLRILDRGDLIRLGFGGCS